MRTKKSLKNTIWGISSQLLLALLGFVTRKIFVDSLGTEYLGLNGLLTNVIAMLGLVEGGIGTSIVFNLYKPLADKDQPKIIALVQLYKKLYGIIALVTFVISMCIFPFLHVFIKDGSSLSYISIVFFLFVAQNMLSYLYAYKWSLINADQNGYVLVKVNLIFQIVSSVVKIFILLTLKNYIIYLVMNLLCILIQNVINSRTVDKMYPFINTKEKFKVDGNIKNNLIINVKASFLHNIGNFCVSGTDNILISTFVSISSVGLYSNYALVVNQLSTLFAPVMNGFGASVGNLIAVEKEEKIYSIFKTVYFLNFWIYSFSVILLYNLLNPFISWWLGGEFLLDKLTVIVILFNFYLTGMRSSVLTFKIKAGILNQDKYVPLIESLINLVASIILVKYLGIAGVFLGTTISTLSIVFWNQPRLIYKYLFKKPVYKYFIRYIMYTFLTMVAASFTTVINNIIFSGNSFGILIGKGIVCISITGILYTVLFYKTESFQYLFNIIKKNIFKPLVRYPRF